MVSFLLVLNCLFALVFLRARGIEYLSPAFMFFYSWSIICVLYFIPLLEYERELTLRTYLIVSAAHLSFLLGVIIPRAPHRSVIHVRQNPVRRPAKTEWLFFYGSLALVSLLFTAQEVAGPMGRALLSDFSSAIETTRDQGWDRFYRGEASVSPLKSFGLSGAFVIAVLAPVFLHQNRKKWFWFSLLCIAIVAISSFLSAGRMTLGVLGLSLAIGFHVVFRPFCNPITLRTGAALAGVSFFFFIVFPLARNAELDGQIDFFISLAGDFRISGIVHSISEVPGFGWIKISAYSLSYFPQALDKLNFFVEYGLNNLSLRYGFYNFPLANQFLALITDGISPWHATRLEIGEILRPFGWGTNPWSTGIRDVAVDFGMPGAFFFCGIFGYLAQSAYYQAVLLKRPETFVLGVILSVGSFVFPFIAWMQIRILSNTVVLLLVGLVAAFFLRTLIKRQRRMGSQYAAYRSIRSI